MEYIKKLIENENIMARIKEVAEEIDNDYDNEIVMVCVLKGSMPFFIKLTENMSTKNIWDLIKVKSYNGMNRGDVDVIIESSVDVTNRDVIIVEDIVDSGATLQYLIDYYLRQNAKSVRTCSLLDKKDNRELGYENVEPDYCCFSVPNNFIVGFGLDYKEYYRDLDYIGYIPTELINDFINSFEQKNYVRERKK